MNLLQAYEVVDSHFLVVKESDGMTALVIDTTSDKSVSRLFNFQIFVIPSGVKCLVNIIYFV